MKCTNSIFKPLGLIFLLCLLPFLGHAQNITVKGTVKDAFGPVIGASVVQKGTSNGIVTDMNGNFTLNVPANSTILVSFIGYKTQEIAVAGKKQIDVTLKEDTELLDEVVVVGYGQMKRSDLTGSVVSVNEDVIKKSVVTSVDQALQGRAAGVQVQANTGMPGGSSSIRIRGVNSLNSSNEPIFVIDGVIIDNSTGSGSDNALSSINPSDIVSMDVLKDASATAIYGARAANGVIMITTKRGQAGEASITYDGYVGWQEMPNKLDVLNLREYAEHRNVRSGKDYAGQDWGIVNKDNNFVRPDLLGDGTDWQDEMFSKALMTSHNLSVTGGNDKNNYAMGAGYLQQDGIAVGSGFRRLNLRGSFDSQVKEYLKMGINFAFSESRQKLTISDESLIRTALLQTPNVAVRNADGNFDGPDTDEFVQTNPVGLAMLNDNRNEKMNIRANTYAEAKILEGLTFKTELSFDYGITNTYKFNPSYDFGAITNEVRTGAFSKSYNKYWSWRNIVNYNRTFGVHSINAMVGQEMQQSHWEYLYGARTGYLSNASTDLVLGDATTATNNGNSGESSILSYFGRMFYSFNDRYLLTFTMRRDGSSKFHKDNRWGWFPSAALAWKVSNESFLKENPVINNLKLRLGWGAVGNQNVVNNAYRAIYSSLATTWGTGVLAGNTPNPELQWETTYSSNIGLDLNLFDNRIEFIADFYYKKTKDLLLQVPLPAYVGTSSSPGATAAPWKNIGSLENKGVELTLNTVNIDKKGFQWRSNLVFSLNRNKVKELDTATSLIDKTNQTGSLITILTRTAVGQPIGQFYGYKVIGRFEKATDFYYKDGEGKVKPVALPEGMEIGKNSMWIGDYIFEDLNKDGVINEKDRTYIGNPEPDFTFGFGNTFSYKGIDLSIYLNGSVGNEVVNWGRREMEDAHSNNNLLKDALNYAKLGLIDPNGPDDYRNVQIVDGDAYACRMSGSTKTNESNYRFSNLYVEDGSYLRIQSISLGYTLPKKWVRTLKLENLKLYCNLQNVYTFTKYKGMDPEIGSANQDALLTGFDNYRYPSPRIYTFGMNVTF
ncbi:MAG: TonB-dependent receptor [Bacteroides sp.]|uniref:SusC/RagA family TonB-linked outer membrane protein n=1 Tax=Bacteroides sp. TaxID=29523 RepID=UPI0026E0E3A6|nr:TonB-dependent receptor [Bacteroides sp.]MDO5421228.1 TonB-dependent receptor [Bacteroides sp.]